MKVAILSTSSWRTPPRHYGPSELFASHLTEGLLARGVDVTLFATADSTTRAELQAVVPVGTEEDRFFGSGQVFAQSAQWQSQHILNCIEQASRFDIIHNNFNFPPLIYTPQLSTPMVTTVHSGRVEFDADLGILEEFKRYNAGTSYVSISQAAQHPDLQYVKNIYHGIDLTDYTFQSHPGEYLLVFGRMDHDKGVAEAITVAKRFGMKLVLAGIVSNPAYFESEIRPHLADGVVKYIGSVGGAQKQAVLAGAYALLHLINFQEPFGLSVIEAMAAGTPVIALNKGAMPEIIESGRSGFVVESTDQVLDHLGRISEIDRTECRAVVTERFTSDSMVSNYLELFEEILRG